MEKIRYKTITNNKLRGKMKKIVLITILITSLSFCKDIVKKELNQVKGRMMWLKLEQKLLSDLQIKLQEIEDGKIKEENLIELNKIIQDYKSLRTPEGRKIIRTMDKKLKKIKN